MTTLTQQQIVSVLQAALTVFREEIDPEISAARILTYLAVVKNPGMQQLDLPQFVKGISTSGASRNILDLTETTSARKPGPDLITQKPDPAYRKRNLLYPTVKGQHWIEQLTKKVGAATAGLFRG